MNQSEALINAAMRSISRANTIYLATTAYGIKSQALLFETQGNYLMKYSMGNPPVDSFGIVDTGSELIWMQCEPCEDCFYQNPQIFDPMKSSTYQKVSCHTNTCDLVHVHACGASDVCKYEITYGDGSMTSGELGSDTISFGSLRHVVIPNIVFGCGHVNTGIFRPASTGIVGLGQGPLSLVSRLGDLDDHKFSYCLVPRYSEIDSKLKFGWEANISASRIVTAPLVDKYPYSFYHLRLFKIYIGRKVVRPPATSDIIIDVGATLTFLETSLYESVEAAVIEANSDGPKPINNPPTPLRLCYLDGTIKFVPKFIFIFFRANKGLRLNVFNVFQKINNLICLMMAPKEGYSIFGNIAQVDFKVLYDLQAKTVSFASADCSKK
ncbi:aspartic proteinase CDR1-like [Lotus japonicus]|uniref:aspartic proteinase CDR1-like n=1 Tax=Lotus japonicus TaxID=34305 RepID=UPI002584B350|nr:aspartic proteinase CDR1-like [Lotus japonicus]